jgi:hypothetical protein
MTRQTVTCPNNRHRSRRVFNGCNNVGSRENSGNIISYDNKIREATRYDSIFRLEMYNIVATIKKMVADGPATLLRNGLILTSGSIDKTIDTIKAKLFEKR